MKKEEILQMFNEFINTYNEQEKDAIWKKHSQFFRDYWQNTILNNKIKELNESEIDQIIKILDRHGRGNTPTDEAVARAMIAQGAWRRMFREIKENTRLQELLNNIFNLNDDNKKIESINELYMYNEGRKNNLTGKSGNAINAMLVAFDPATHLSAISLNDRKKIIDYFGFTGGPDFETDTPGKKIVLSNITILNGFRSLGIKYSPRTITVFLYQSPIKTHWRGEEIETNSDAVAPIDHPIENLEGDISLFYMESQLEDFLIENWDKTELGKKYDLIEENGELVSQQYQTEIGKIDILAQDKQTKQYVVIELKRNQTSDDTIGQLTRYMGWLEEHKTNGQTTKGIIIAARYDDRLHYASKKIKDIEIYLYKVNFKLAEFKKI